MIPPLLAEARGHLDKPDAGELFAQGLWLELEKFRERARQRPCAPRRGLAEIQREAVRALIMVYAHGYPPSKWLCHLIGDLLGFSKKPRDEVRNRDAFSKATIAMLKDQGIGLNALARLSGVSPSNVKEWEKTELWQQLFGEKPFGKKSIAERR